MNKEEAIRATRNGAIAACISGGATLIFAVFAISGNASSKYAYWNDPAIFFDVALIFVCAFGIFKKSRLAAVSIFAYFISSKILIMAETGIPPGILASIFFIYFYARAIQGSFIYHKIEKSTNPNYKSTSKLAYFIGIPILLIFLVIIGFGVLTTTGVFPSTEVLSGQKISQKDKNDLISNEIITADDKIQYFYSNGITSILEGGSVLTDDRVILYMPDENDKIGVYEIYFEDIASIELVQPGGSLDDSIYKINSHIPDAWLQISLSAENKGDKKFINALQNNLKAANTAIQ